MTFTFAETLTRSRESVELAAAVPRTTTAHRRGGLYLLLGVMLAGCGAPASKASASSPAPPLPRASLAIVDVNILPHVDEGPAEHQTVLIDGDSIVWVGPSHSISVPSGTAVIYGRGKFLMPGMADMHVHLPDDATGNELARIALFLVANGVTTIRSMKGAPSHLTYRDVARRQGTLAPTMFLAGPPVADNFDPEQARALVRTQKAAGYDFVKLLGGIERAGYDALVDEARRYHFPLCGHVPQEIGIDAALAAGQNSIEHLMGYVAAVKANPDAMKELAPRTREAGVWNCPTLDFYGVALEEDVARLEGREGLRFVTAEEVAAWRKERGDGPPKDSVARMKRLQGIVAALAHAKAKILVGSDTPGAYRVPGFSYVEELRRLHDAGLSNAEVLDAATRGAAEYLGASSRMGRVARGMQADLVLLDASPLEELGNVTRRAGVVLRGRWISRDDVEQLLSIYLKQSP